MATVLLFVDGVGVGRARESNPLVRRRSADPRALFSFAIDREDASHDLGDLPPGWTGTTLDAALGVPGLPQSATGQATIFTGRNAAAALGRHQSAFPGGELRALVTEHSLLKGLARAGRSVTFANAYGPSFPGHHDASVPRRSSVTTLASRAAGLRFRTYDDLRTGDAVYHDITRWTTGARGEALPEIPPHEAGAHLATLAGDHDLVVHEHFLLDLAGHGRIAADPVALLATLDGFVSSLAAALDPAADAIVVVSDHGNVEDGDTRRHTDARVPLLRWGVAAGIPLVADDLTTVAPLVTTLVEAPCRTR